LGLGGGRGGEGEREGEREDEPFLEEGFGVDHVLTYGGGFPCPEGT
jgi:hypothetical protein